MTKRQILAEIIQLLEQNSNRHIFGVNRVCHPTFSQYHEIYKMRTWSISGLSLCEDGTIVSLCGYTAGPVVSVNTFSLAELQMLKNFMEEDLCSLAV